MKNFLILVVSVVFFLHTYGQELTFPPNGNNQKAKVTQWIGVVETSIQYNSPNVHGPSNVDRKGRIWGELVPYGFTDLLHGPSTSAPWRAGANENTTITFSHDVKIGGKELKAGKYGLFIKTEKEGPWTWIFSKNATSWGSFLYDPKEDALRVDVQPEEAPYTEFLTYGFDKRMINSAEAYIQWENKRLSMPIEVPNYKQYYVDRMREDLRGWAGFNYQNWTRASQWCATNNVNLEEALVWADNALTVVFRNASSGVENFNTYQTKALVLNALGRTAEADLIMEKAIKHPTANMIDIFLYTRGLIPMGRNEKALEIFKYCREHYPTDKFAPYWGLALTYTALGDKKNAIENWQIAINNIPADMRSRLPAFEQQLKKLQE